MTRRGFLQFFATSAVLATVPSFLISTNNIAPTRKVLSEKEQREAMIAKALNTPEGRKALAQAMTEPLICTLNYQKAGRSLLMVDKLPS